MKATSAALLSAFFATALASGNVERSESRRSLFFSTFAPELTWINALEELVVPELYEWGHFAMKELDTAKPRTCGHHNSTLAALDRRQADTCSDGYIMSCPATDEFPCCPVASPNCCPAPSGVCCPDGKFCQGLKTCCTTGTTGCGESCCASGSTCCGTACCSSGYTCNAGTCVLGQTSPSGPQPTPNGNNNNNNNGNSNSNNGNTNPKPKVNAAVIGGAVGGAVGGLLLIGLAAFLIIKLSKKKKTAPSNIYSPASPHPGTLAPGPGTTPVPYPPTPYSSAPSNAPLMAQQPMSAASVPSWYGAPNSPPPENPYSGYTTPAPPAEVYNNPSAPQPMPYMHSPSPGPQVQTWVERPQGGNVGWDGAGAGGYGGGPHGGPAY